MTTFWYSLIRSRVLDEGVHDLLVAGDVEMDRELVVFDRDDRAVAEFLVKHPFADGKAADPAQFLTALRHRARIGEQGAARRGRRPPRCRRRDLDRACPSGIPSCRGLQAELGDD